MHGEKEHLIKPNTRVWIGNQLTPVPTGTYNRYYTSKETGKMLDITFKRVDLTEETYNKRTTAMSVELIARPPRKTNTLSNIDVLNSEDWEEYSLVSRVLCYDKPYPQIFKQDIIEQQKSFPPTQDSNHIVITDDDLRAAQSAGFFIENCGTRHPFPTDEIFAVTSDHVQDTITIQKRGANGKTINLTYSLKKIENCGKLPKKD